MSETHENTNKLKIDFHIIIKKLLYNIDDYSFFIPTTLRKSYYWKYKTTFLNINDATNYYVKQHKANFRLFEN